MNANGRVNSRVFFCEIDRAAAALDRGADGDDARYTAVVRATKHILEIISEIRIIEVRVGFN